MAVLLREGNRLTICGRTTRDEFDAWMDYVCETCDAGEQTVILDLRTTITATSWIIGRVARVCLYARRRGVRLVVRAVGMLARKLAAARLDQLAELDPPPPATVDATLASGSDPCPEAAREVTDELRGPFCQSCGVPMTEPGMRGTETDGSDSSDYCSSCYRDGAFTDPEASIEGLAVKTSYMLALRMGVDPEQLAPSVRSFMTRLVRWRNEGRPASSRLSLLP